MRLLVRPTSALALLLLAAPTWGQVYNQFSPGGDLAGAGSTWNSQVITNAAVTLAKQANLPANTVQGNNSASASSPTGMSPLTTSILMSSPIAAFVAVSLTTGTPAFGVYTNDGIALASNDEVLVIAQAGGQTCGVGTISNGTGGAVSAAGACEGLWIVHAAAPWTRSPRYPSGQVIPQFCNVLFLVARGITNQGHLFQLSQVFTSTVTIDTTNPNIIDVTLAAATTTSLGTVKVTDNASLPVVNFSGPVTAIGDCPGFSTTGGISDVGDVAFNTGQCVVSNANGFVFLQGNGTPPTITGTGHGTLSAGGSNHRGVITGNSAATSITVTFSATWPITPACIASDSSASVVGVSAVSTAAVTFSVTALTGSLYYICL